MKKAPKDQIADMIDNADKGEQIMLKWREHVEQKHSIKSYSVVISDVMYTISTDSEGALFPHVEFESDKQTHWVVKLTPDGREILRANIKSIDLIEWNLFPSKTN